MIDDELKKKLMERYDCNHIKVNKLFFGIVDNGERIPIYARIVSQDGCEIYEKNDKYFIRVDKEEFIVCFNEKPQSYETMIGTKKASDIARTKGRCHMAVTINHFCIYFYENKKCLFCNIDQWPTNTDRTISELIEVIYCYQESKDIK